MTRDQMLKSFDTIRNLCSPKFKLTPGKWINTWLYTVVKVAQGDIPFLMTLHPLHTTKIQPHLLVMVKFVYENPSCYHQIRYVNLIMTLPLQQQ